MSTLLHVVATPRGEGSRTLQISLAFLKCLKDTHPDWKIATLDLFGERLPKLTVRHAEGKYRLLEGKDVSGEAQQAWQELVDYIEQFLSADRYLISSPMWNFGIPYVLKHYLDIIVQPRYLFRYTQNGPEGLVKNKKMVIITTRGGDYSSEPARSYDLQEPYLKAIFNFVGITDIQFINAQPMDALGPEVQKSRLEAAIKQAREITSQF